MKRIMKQKKSKRKIIWMRRIICGLLVLFVLGGVGHMCLNRKELPPQVSAFSNVNEKIVKGKIPSFYQYDNRWKDKRYGDDTMKITGCGPTCLSMVLCGLSGEGEYSPAKVAGLSEKWGYYAQGSGSLWSLMSEGAEKLGLHCHEVTFDSYHIQRELKKNRPIICVVGPGDFTTEGHFIVLCGVDEDGMITVHDPNSVERSNEKWSLDDLMPQIKNLWSYTL